MKWVLGYANLCYNSYLSSTISIAILIILIISRLIILIVTKAFKLLPNWLNLWNLAGVLY